MKQVNVGDGLLLKNDDHIFKDLPIIIPHISTPPHFLLQALSLIISNSKVKHTSSMGVELNLPQSPSPSPSSSRPFRGISPMLTPNLRVSTSGAGGRHTAGGVEVWNPLAESDSPVYSIGRSSAVSASFRSSAGQPKPFSSSSLNKFKPCAVIIPKSQPLYKVPYKSSTPPQSLNRGLHRPYELGGFKDMVLCDLSDEDDDKNLERQSCQSGMRLMQNASSEQLQSPMGDNSGEVVLCCSYWMMTAGIKKIKIRGLNLKPCTNYTMGY